MGIPTTRYGAVEVLERAHGRRRQRWSAALLVVEPCRLAGFLLMQAAFAWCVLPLLLVLLVLSVALFPLCGLGLVLLRLGFRSGAVEVAALCDVLLVNSISSDSEQIQIDRADDAARSLLSTRLLSERMVSGLDSLSFESLTVLLYLVTIKMLMASLGLLVVLTATTVPVYILSCALWVDLSSQSLWETLCAFFALALVFVVACIGMDVVTRISVATTRFFCCEPVPAAQPWRQVSASRANVVIIRLAPPIATALDAAAPPST
ncbi:hypothetical protein P43SY_001923 [Pythium insidiosum]|uniref:Uncharacterized protein n=1 Tax=Pythium insidiosum TaxID=114742 RepID=A0AAD5QAB0_PYTIN|nr:hypothetical protein P43SY_001923 [Pythium insidiosum]